MRLGFLFLMMFALIASAYFSAQNKLSTQKLLPHVFINMTSDQLKESFGTPYARDRNLLVYILDDSSLLKVTLRDELVTSAIMVFYNPIKIEDPKMKELSLIQMDSNNSGLGDASWFFAGKPEEGLIYKITNKGLVESMTWVEPFSYGNNQPKQLQALLHDFHVQKLPKL